MQNFLNKKHQGRKVSSWEEPEKYLCQNQNGNDDNWKNKQKDKCKILLNFEKNCWKKKRKCWQAGKYFLKTSLLWETFKKCPASFPDALEQEGK